MPRPPKDYSTPQPYMPYPPPVAGSTPEEITRAVWDELHRIAAYLADPTTPLGAAAAEVPNADQPH